MERQIIVPKTHIFFPKMMLYVVSYHFEVFFSNKMMNINFPKNNRKDEMIGRLTYHIHYTCRANRNSGFYFVPALF